VAVISSSPEQDKLFEAQCREALKGYDSSASITYLSDLPLTEVIDKVRALPQRSVILYVFQQAKDEQGRVLQTPDVLNLIVRAARVPIYGIANWQVGNGIVGGYLRVNDENGARTSAIALRVASGTPAQDIPLEMVPVVPMFDWRELRRWGIDEARLPPGSIVQFRVPSFWDHYKWYGIAATAALFLQSLLIAGLMFNRARRKRAEADRQVAQSEVAESRARLAAIVGSALDAIISIDENQRIVLFNEAAEKVFGCHKHDALGQRLDRLIPDWSHEAHERHVQGFGESNGIRKIVGASRSLYARRKNGEQFPIESSISQLELHGKKFYTVIVRDITEREQSDQALRESEARFRNMADNAPAMIWVSGPDNGCTYCNRGWLDFTGRSMQQQLGSGWAEIVHPDDHARCVETYTSAFERRAPMVMEYRLRRADGEYRWIYDVGAPNISPAGELMGYIGTCVDITDHKQSEETLALLLEQVNQLKNQLQADNIYLQEEIKLEHNFNEIIGTSDAINRVLFSIEKVAPTDTTVLITGETGTGKELVARAIHSASARSQRALVKVNCAALPATLIEAELFGHEKGAFTGADVRKQGRFELADGATIFLDEIGELPLQLQVKLLRVLQEGEFERLGSSKTMKTDVRIIAATNRRLESEVKKGAFRNDLWYRLNVFPVLVPPLRERKQDIPLLVSHFVKRFSKGAGKLIQAVSPAAMRALEDYSWPGNVRELANVIERAVISSGGSTLVLAEPLVSSKSIDHAVDLKPLEEIERDHIVRALTETDGKIEGPGGAAALLGLNPSTLRGRMSKLRIRRQRGRKFIDSRIQASRTEPGSDRFERRPGPGPDSRSARID
jgi:PAS domain S-box-containing protein